MKYLDLIDRLSEHWYEPDVFTSAAKEDRRLDKSISTHCGDTLALFVCRELKDTFCVNETEANQLQTAREALDRAIADLTRLRKSIAP
jgi:hypothetical protein